MNIKKSFALLTLILTLTSNVLAVDTSAGEFPFQGKLTSNDINLRAGPNTSYESLDKLQKEAKVDVLTQRYDWYKIALPKTTSCFISRKFLKRTSTKKGIVTGNMVNLRAKPSEDASIIGKINADYVVRVIKAHPEWYEIAGVGDVASGWMHKKFVARSTPEPEVIVVPPNTEEKAIKAEVKEEHKPRPIARGKIRSMGIFFRRKGSHKLVIDGRLKYYLKGERKYLNRFVGYNVNIFGKIVDGKNQKIPLIEVERVEIIK